MNVDNKLDHLKRRVLLVEANEDKGILITDLLRLSGYDCVRVETMAEGLRLASIEPFDLYLLEL